MKGKIIFRLVSALLLLVALSCSKDSGDSTERTKIALREVGNQLLLNSQDSTSLILPITAVTSSKYRLAFKNALHINPDTLVSIIQQTFKRTELSDHYRVEVLQCANEEVAYSYQISEENEQTLIPCSGRVLPKDCYYVEVKFLGLTSLAFPRTLFIYAFGIITLLFVGFKGYKDKARKKDSTDSNYVKVGQYKFFEAQNMLIKEAEEIALSKKECELLAIFVDQPNEVVTRDELTKRVWEDNGVIVGRSLDTFISKLRKKLSADHTLSIENVHGVGYKLVVKY